MEIKFNIEPLHEAQSELMHLAFGSRGKLDRIYVFPGRGFGKSVAAIVLGGTEAIYYPGDRVMVTYPSWSDARDTGLTIFEEIFPPECYRLNRSEMSATFLHNRSKVLFRSRTTSNAVSTRQKGRGQTNNRVIHDEAAIDRAGDTCRNFNATVRGKNARGVIYVTTPKIGWMKNEVDKFGIGDCSWGWHFGDKLIRDEKSGTERLMRAAALYARTADNPYGGEELHMTMLGELDERMAAQELDGQWVAISGRLWDNWSWDRWPAGNVHPHRYNPQMPWILSADFGAAKSSWIAWQTIKDRGETIAVAVAEWQLDNAGVKECLSQIDADMGGRPPEAVYSGHDLNTRAVVSTNLTPRYFINKQWGSIMTPALGGLAMDPRVRYERMRAATCAANNRRTVCVSANIHSVDQGGRGIKKVIEQDSWPENNQNYMNKDGVLEHCRDALHHYIAMVAKPNMASGRYAQGSRRWAPN